MEQAQRERQTVTIRELDTDTWAVVRNQAARRRWTTSAVLEHIVREWLAAQQNAAASEVA